MMITPTNFSDKRGAIALKLIFWCAIFIAITTAWLVLNRHIIDDFLQARHERNLALENLEKQREHRNRTVRMAGKQKKYPILVKARDELGLCLPGELIIQIDEDNQTSFSLQSGKAELEGRRTTGTAQTARPKDAAAQTTKSE